VLSTLSRRRRVRISNFNWALNDSRFPKDPRGGHQKGH